METIIIADDMTGSNVSNSLLAKQGFKVGTISQASELGKYSNYDAIGIHTDSRGVSAQEAYSRVKEQMVIAKDVDTKFYTKRIDSTMRGNVGSELDAMLDVLGDEYIGLVVPSFPDSEKIVIGNFMLVDGVLLENTDVKNDPTSPVNTSRIINVFRQQTNRQIGVISMETIIEGKEAIADTIISLKEYGTQIILFDACTNEDIDVIAEATILSNIKFVAVDPGPYTSSLVQIAYKDTDMATKKNLLFVIGSVSGVAISQIARFRAELDPYIVRVNSRAFLYEDMREDEKNNVVQNVIKNLNKSNMFLVATMINKEDKLDLKKEAEEAQMSVHDASEIISSSIADIGNMIARKMGDSLGGVYTSGGDITKAFLDYTDTTGIQIKDEIIPLAVYGEIMGGSLNGIPIVTKGGLIGDEFTLTECATYLQNRVIDSEVESKGELMQYV